MATEFHKRSLTTSKILFVLHASTLYQNSFYSTVHPAPGMAGVSKEAKMHKKFESVWIWCTVIQIDFKDVEKLWKLCFMQFFFNFVDFFLIANQLYVCKFSMQITLFWDPYLPKNWTNTYFKFIMRFGYLKGIGFQFPTACRLIVNI